MQAAILVEQRSPLVVADVELPRTLSRGQVRVRLAYSGICGSQLGEIDGVKGDDPWLPHLLGHEGAGVVEAVGEDVDTVAPGDHVVLHWMKGAGLDADTPRYDWDGRALNAGWVTTFNEVAVVAENRVTAIPTDFDLALAPLLGCAVTTGMGVVENEARLQAGESIVVFGAGGVGLSVIQAAVMSGGSPIVAVDVLENRLSLASRLGADHVVDASREDVAAAVSAIVGPAGADVCVENTGDVAVIETAYELTAPRGRTILVGVPPVGKKARLYTLPLHFGKVLKGTHGGSSRPDVDIPRCVDLYREGRLRLDELVTDRYSLERINEAIDDLRSGAVTGRCLVELGQAGAG